MLINEARIRVERQPDRPDPHSFEIKAFGLTIGRYQSFRDCYLFYRDRLMFNFTLKTMDKKTAAAKTGGVKD
jgi:hypothetical protein